MACNDEYEIALIDNETNARQCAEFMAVEFSLKSPFSVFNQASSESLFNTWLCPLIMDVFDQKLSFLMRHRPTNQIVAAVIAQDLFPYCEKHPYDALAPASEHPAADLFDEALNHFVHHEFNQELKPNMVLFISAIATRSNYSGKGLMVQLNALVCSYARDTKGFQYAFLQAAHPATRHIYTKRFSGIETAVTDPRTWLWKRKDDGLSRPFKDLKDGICVNILIKLNKLN